MHNPSTVGGGADAICRGDGCQHAAAAGGAGGRRGARRTQALGADAELARVGQRHKRYRIVSKCLVLGSCAVDGVCVGCRSMTFNTIVS